MTTAMLRLTHRQHELLSADVADHNPTDERADLAAELRRGRNVTVTDVLIAEVRELADHDQVIEERATYRLILAALLKPRWVGVQTVYSLSASRRWK